eukprot:RCo045568
MGSTPPGFRSGGGGQLCERHSSSALQYPAVSSPCPGVTAHAAAPPVEEEAPLLSLRAQIPVDASPASLQYLRGEPFTAIVKVDQEVGKLCPVVKPTCPVAEK